MEQPTSTYLTAAEVAADLVHRVQELAPVWAAAQENLDTRLLEALHAAPAEIMTRLDYAAFLDEFAGRHAEWVDGRVILMTPVSIKHQLIAQFLLKLLDEYARLRDLGVVLSAPVQMRLRSLNRGREPDIMFVASRNIHRLRPTYLDGPADLAIEIVSPESIGRDRGEKYVEYAAAGVAEYWLIDPQRQQAEFYQLGADSHYRPTAPDAQGRYTTPALPGLWLAVDWLWQEPLPSVVTALREIGALL